MVKGQGKNTILMLMCIFTTIKDISSNEVNFHLHIIHIKICLPP